MILLTPGEISDAKKGYTAVIQAHPTVYPQDTAVAQAQLKAVAQWLLDNGARFVKDEWEAIGHGGYYELDWDTFEQFLKEAGLKEE